jgi:hypothetical protein
LREEHAQAQRQQLGGLHFAQLDSSTNPEP